MLKIGEFARISQLSIKMLRHYDTLGLLRPAYTDPDSGYRLYEVEQLIEVVRILALKDCGLTLDEIAQLLRTQDTQVVEALLSQRMTEQVQFVGEEQARLQRMSARLQQLTALNNERFLDIALKQTQPVTLVGLRKSISSSEEVAPFAQAVGQRLLELRIPCSGPTFHLYYEDQAGNDQMLLFVGAAVTALPVAQEELHCECLPGGEHVACVMYRGASLAELLAVWIAVERWIKASGYQRNGPCREIYHRLPSPDAGDSAFLIELQYPVLKILSVFPNETSSTRLLR
jgi:DNA-binding transcriptional MerR regulator